MKTQKILLSAPLCFCLCLSLCLGLCTGAFAQQGPNQASKPDSKMLSAELTKRHADSTLKSLIAWGRHASIIGYNADSDELFLVESSE